MKKKKKKVITVAGISFILILGLVSWYVFAKAPDFEKLSDEKVIEYIVSKNVDKLNEKNLAKLGERVEKIDFNKRRELLGNLTSEERGKYRENSRKVQEAYFNKRLDEFFSLPVEKQNEFLDKEIDKMLENMQRARERRGNFPAFRENTQIPNPPNIEQGQQQDQQVTSARRGRGRPSPDAMLQRRRQRLSETTPEERAKRMEYFRRLRARMAQRGIRPGFRR
ncbi:MAG TPA: hypothetical protein P5150_05135 [Candidatus Ratteibacteria bacterium]|nr:hypothetical protein [Candidatus Ratteibacteria bacterium]